MTQLPLQFFLVEPLAFEGLHPQRMGREGILALWKLRQAGNFGGVNGVLLQPQGILRHVRPALAQAHDGDLLEFLKLAVGEPPDGQSLKVVRQHPADVRGKPVVGNNIDQQAAVHQVRKALDQEPLLMPGPTAALIEDGQIGRVEEQQMERLLADLAEKEAAEAHPMQAGLGLLSPALVQLYPVGIAVIPLSELPQGFPAAAAGVKQIGGHLLRELDAPQNEGDVIRVGGVVAQPDIVHQPANYRRVGGPIHGEFLDEVLDGIVDGAVDIAHQVKPKQARLEHSRRLGVLVLLRLHQKEAGLSDGLGQLAPDGLQQGEIVPGGGQVGVLVLLHPGSLDYHALRQISDGALQGFQLLHRVAPLRLPAHRRSPPSGACGTHSAVCCRT